MRLGQDKLWIRVNQYKHNRGQGQGWAVEALLFINKQQGISRCSADRKSRVGRELPRGNSGARSTVT